jgi:hypothetical protein
MAKAKDGPGSGATWTRLVAIRAAFLGMQGRIDDLEVAYKDLAAKAREKGQAFSSLCDGMINPELSAKDKRELMDKLPGARRALKTAENRANVAKTDLRSVQAERERLGALFEQVFDEAARGESLYDQAKPGTDDVRGVLLSDLLDEAACATLLESGIVRVGDFVDAVKKRGGVDNLKLAEDSCAMACEAVSAALAATGDAKLPPVLREFVPEARPVEPAEGAGEGGDEGGKSGGRKLALAE